MKRYCHITGSLLEFKRVSLDAYLSYRDIANGEEDKSCDCPECSGYFFYDDGICICCGYEMELTCERCDTQISPDEVSGFDGLCSYCRHQWEKMMDE